MFFRAASCTVQARLPSSKSSVFSWLTFRPEQVPKSSISLRKFVRERSSFKNTVRSSAKRLNLISSLSTLIPLMSLLLRMLTHKTSNAVINR